MSKEGYVPVESPVVPVAIEPEASTGGDCELPVFPKLSASLTCGKFYAVELQAQWESDDEVSAFSGTVIGKCQHAGAMQIVFEVTSSTMIESTFFLHDIHFITIQSLKSDGILITFKYGTYDSNPNSNIGYERHARRLTLKRPVMKPYVRGFTQFECGDEKTYFHMSYQERTVVESNSGCDIL